jgi:hypothetical protein
VDDYNILGESWEDSSAADEEVCNIVIVNILLKYLECHQPQGFTVLNVAANFDSQGFAFELLAQVTDDSGNVA